jgi:predicted O-methyltransferase YrrM
MQNSLNDPAVMAVLDRLHGHDRANVLGFLAAAVPTIVEGWFGRRPSIELEAKRFRKMAIGLDRDCGKLAYLTARAIRAQRIVEFGTSFGISTLYLAAAVRDNGGGIVIGSEIEPGKIEEARANIAAAGLIAFAEVRAGNALESLADPDGAVDLVLLDGWKDLYLPVLRLIEPHLRPGAVILADNITMFKSALRPYVDYVQDVANGYQSVTLKIGSGFEYSVRV